jgi:peptide/nickel transport system ATP-binding protein
MTPPVHLSIVDLTVASGSASLVHGLSFAIAEGKRVGLIGESGSGKSLTASAIMGLLPEGLTAAGSAKLGGRELIGAPERELSRLRGREMSMVFQEPMTALNPAMRIGRQVAEGMLLHRTRPDRRAAHAAAVELLDAVRLPDPAHAARAYPHQLSGGQRQRVLLAIALANDPALLICDEPTTALDVTVQAQILELITAGVARRGTALLFITHDLAVVAQVCERVLVLYEGRIVEAGPTRDVLTAPRHDYTRRLLAASELEPR